MSFLRKSFHDMPIRLKMFYTCSLIVITTVLLVGGGVYFQVSRTIEKNIENALSNATSTILKMVETTAQASIKNYLRAVTEKNLQIVSQYHSKVQDGLITEYEAKQRLKEIFFMQTIGDTGYIYCLDSNGKAAVHPNSSVEGVNFSKFNFIQEQVDRKQGYLEYMWKNPEETQARPKALYMTYFEPWDWIISVSSYRSEFNRLINISDFRENILSQTFGKTGYSYVLSTNGDVVIHPHLSGNLWDAQDAEGNYHVRRQSRTKSGKILYSWRNPGEEKFREKLVIYNYIKEYDWIVASTGYIEEFYAPLKSIRNIVVTTIAVIMVLVLPAAFIIASSITRPLQQLETRFSQGTEGNFSGRMTVESKDEIGKLAVYFNQFMDKLENSSRKIQKEIEERRKAEELFSKAFHASPSGIFIVDLRNNRFINANSSFLNFIGHSRDEVVDKTVDALPMFRHDGSIDHILGLLKKEGRVRDLDVEFINADGNPRLGTINAETVYIWGELCLLCAVEDLTETKRLEREIIDISERERLQLGQYLHDDLSSHLLGIEVLQKVLGQKLAKEGSSHLDSVDAVRALVKDAIDKTGRISRGLCPTHIAEKELELTLKELCRDIEQIYNVSCRLEHEKNTILLRPQIAVHIYCIAREAAYNALKHGKAASILLSLSCKGNEVRLKISDDGRGLPEKIESNGMGIRIMRYRARRIGATLDIRNNPKGGTRLTLAFSLTSEEKGATDGIQLT